MLQRIHDLAKHQANFAFETTMASKTFHSLLEQCKKDGYQINLLYLWLSSPELAIERVKYRTMSGAILFLIILLLDVIIGVFLTLLKYICLWLIVGLSTTTQVWNQHL